MSTDTRPVDYKHQKRYLNVVYTGMVVLYFFVGAALILAEKMRPRVPYFDQWPNAHQFSGVPTGSSDQDVTAYFDYLRGLHLFTFKETYLFNPLTISATYLGLGVLIIIFIFFSKIWFARHQHGDLYPVEVYGGYVTERGGKVDYFNWAVYAILGTYMLYYAMTNMIYGQIY